MIQPSRWFLVVCLVGCTKLPIGPEPAASVEIASSEVPVAPGQVGGTEVQPSTAFQQSYDDEAAGKLDASLAALDGLRTTGRTAYVASLRRGWLLYRLGKYDDSVLEYGKAAALAPDGVEAKVGTLAPLAALRRWSDVETSARDVLTRDAGNYTATLRLAFALYSQARFADAETTYRRLARLYPSDVEVRDGLGWSLLKLGLARDAGAEFAEVLAIAPQNRLALDGARAAGVAGATNKP